LTASRWAEFYDAVAERPPHDTVVEALDQFDREGRRGFAVDLGCGDGRETVELVRRGWRVLAIDAEPEAIARLRARPGLADVETAVARFEDATWPDVDLVNAGFSLPFCPPEHFGAVWARIAASIRPGGRFSGQLFGDRDEWAGEREMTFMTRAEAESLLAGFELERFDEVEADGQTALGEPKHWHVFHVVARRPDR
jgi:SAM-dependent methyltransferase